MFPFKFTSYNIKFSLHWMVIQLKHLHKEKRIWKINSSKSVSLFIKGSFDGDRYTESSLLHT